MVECSVLAFSLIWLAGNARRSPFRAFKAGEGGMRFREMLTECIFLVHRSLVFKRGEHKSSQRERVICDTLFVRLHTSSRVHQSAAQ